MQAFLEIFISNTEAKFPNLLGLKKRLKKKNQRFLFSIVPNIISYFQRYFFINDIFFLTRKMRVSP